MLAKVYMVSENLNELKKFSKIKEEEFVIML